MLEIRNITKSFGKKKVLDEFSLVVRKGRITALLGENGCGKTTLFRILAGVMKPDRGTVSLNGRSLQKRETGYLPERRSLYPNDTVTEQLEFIGRLRGMKESAIEKRTNELLRIMKEEKLRYNRVGELSKGNQQKVQIACALINEPEVLIADEPFTALDRENIIMLKKLLKLQAERNRITLLSGHEDRIIEQISDEFVFLIQGKPARLISREEMVTDQRRVLEMECTEDFFTLEKYEETDRGIRIMCPNLLEAREKMSKYEKDPQVKRAWISYPGLQDYFPGNN